jgi:hypothetical protein
VVVTGYDDRQGCGYVLSTGADATHPAPGSQPVSHQGLMVRCTPELATTLRDALNRRPVVRLSRSGPEVPLTLDDPTVLAWLTAYVGGVLTVSGGPGPRIAG